MTISLEIYSRVARSIARDAAPILKRYYRCYAQLAHKGVGDVVTEADKESERFITDKLSQLFPEHQILGEEYGLNEICSEFCWAVDPLDGTANYAGGLPIFAVSIALMKKGTPIVGVIYDPNMDRMFHAIRGHGAYCGVEKLSVSKRTSLGDIALFGVSADVIAERSDYLAHLGKGRSLGAASLHLTTVASGQFDGCLDIYTKLWDVAAGSLIVEEAGGCFTDHAGCPVFPLSADSPAYQGSNVAFLATNGHLHKPMLHLLNAS